MPETKPRHVAAALARIPKRNAEHTTQVSAETFQGVQNGQAPWIAVVDCADSRVTIDSIVGGSGRLGKAFNCTCAGNVAKHAIGSLEYAVHHLGVKLIAVEGHTECGAVGAALSDTSGLSTALKGDIDHIKHMMEAAPQDARLNSLDTVTKGVLTNIRAQLKELSTHFATEVASGDVVIVGLLYDLHNKFGGGFGKEYLYCIGDDVNTETLKNHPALAEMSDSERHAFILPL